MKRKHLKLIIGRKEVTLLPLKLIFRIFPLPPSRLNYMSKAIIFKSWNKQPACRGPSVPDAFSKTSSSFYYANSIYLKS